MNFMHLSAVIIGALARPPFQPVPIFTDMVAVTNALLDVTKNKWETTACALLAVSMGNVIAHSCTW